MRVFRKIVTTAASCALVAGVVATSAAATAAPAAASSTVSAAQQKTFDRVLANVKAELRSHDVHPFVNLDDGAACSTDDSPVRNKVTALESGWTEEQADTVDYLGLLNEYYALYLGDQTYGTNGEYTSVVKSELKQLQNFWDIDRWNTNSRGWHSDAVFSKAKMIALDMRFGDTKAQATKFAASVAAEIKTVPGLTKTNPLLSFNSVSDPDTGTIAMGDGIIEVYGLVGFNGTDVERFIMGHEYGHQVQFATGYDPNPSYGMETGADALSGYFVTHAKGLRFDARKIQEVEQAAYDIGDCVQSHGTPTQRKASTQWGSSRALAGTNLNKVLTGAQFIKAWTVEFTKKIRPLDPTDQVSTGAAAAVR
jgi:hypothetical protein